MCRKSAPLQKKNIACFQWVSYSLTKKAFVFRALLDLCRNADQRTGFCGVSLSLTGSRVVKVVCEGDLVGDVREARGMFVKPKPIARCQAASQR